MSKGSAWKNTPEGKTVRRNKITGQWAWLPREALESPAYRALSLSGHRVLARIQLEHLAHAGKENGKLPVTFLDFEEYGIHRSAIAPAIREAEALGFIRITREGRSGNGEWRIPNMFALAHLPTTDDPKPSESWKRIKTTEDAEMIAKTARNAVPKKQKATHGKRTSVTPGKRTSEGHSPLMDSVPQSAPETVPLSISRAVSAAGAPVLPPSSKPELVWSTPVLTEVFGAEKDELLKILAQIPIPIPGKLAAISGKFAQ